jgi:hypothetical protein
LYENWSVYLCLTIVNNNVSLNWLAIIIKWEMEFVLLYVSCELVTPKSYIRFAKTWNSIYTMMSRSEVLLTLARIFFYASDML